jgi:hypothetical protein
VKRGAETDTKAISAAILRRSSINYEDEGEITRKIDSQIASNIDFTTFKQSI